MSKSFGLDTRIENYQGKRPIGFCSWDLECLLDVIDHVLKDGKEYPDKTTRERAFGTLQWRRAFASSRTAPRDCGVLRCVHEQVARSNDRRVHSRRAGLHSPRTGHLLFNIAERGRRLSPQVLAHGPDAGKPKLPPTAKGLIARGLMRLDNEGQFPRLFFTEAGLTALRAMMTDRRLVDPKKFAHVRQELGIDPRSEDEARD